MDQLGFNFISVHFQLYHHSVLYHVARSEHRGGSSVLDPVKLKSTVILSGRAG